MIDTIVGNYRVVEQIGKGGMGIVYRAEHTLIGRPAAIKMLLPRVSSQRDMVQRFFNEAKAATAVKHRGIVEIYDVGHHTDGRAYAIMEYLDGESLGDRLDEQGTLPPLQVLHLARHMAEALAAAHDGGIIHRDLKPDNIFLIEDPSAPGRERTKLLDFGIAKLVDESKALVKTEAGLVMGTPSYMAPEQCRGAGSIDYRADLYSLGCIMFEMLCGRCPFVAPGAGEVVTMQIHKMPPPLRTLRPDVPDAAEEIVLRLLAKEPDDRYQSARELCARLDALLVESDQATTLPTTGAKAVISPPILPKRAEIPPTLPSGLQPALPQRSGPPRSGPRPAMPPPSAPRLAAVANPTPFVPPLPRRYSRGVVALAVGIVILFIAGSLGGAAFFIHTISSEMTSELGSATTIRLTATDAGQAPGPGSSVASSPAAAPSTAAERPEVPERASPRSVAGVRIHIDSVPPGAEVYRQPSGLRVGQTPFHGTFDAANGERVFLLRLPGHKDETISFEGGRDGKAIMIMEPKAKRRDRKRAGSAGKSRGKPAKASHKPDSSKTKPDKPDQDQREIESGGAVDPF